MKQQGKEITRGELLVCWLGFFDIKARISPRKKKKIFLIGLPKTGTTSAHYSLHRHGYKAEHFPYQLVNYNNGTLIFNRKDLKRHDAVSDLPVAASVEQIAKLYPDAYFINTVRNKDSWLDSCRRHPWPIELVQYGNIQNYIRKRSPGNSIYSIITDNLEKIRLLHERVLGTSVFNLDIFAQSYDRYQNKVRDLFAEKNYLELNIADSVDSQEKLGNFLDIEMKGAFARKDCFYTWLFKGLVNRAGWSRLERIRRDYHNLNN